MLFLSFKTVKDQSYEIPNEHIFTLACPKNTFSNVDLNDATAAIKVWGKELQKQLNFDTKFELQIFDNVEDIAKYSQRDDLGLIISNSIDYFKLKAKMHLYPASIPFDGNSVYRKFLILVRNNNYNNLKELKNKKLGLPEIYTNPIPAMWLDVLLGKNKLDKKEKFFSTIKEYDRESQLILSVFFGQNDICVASKIAFETMVELNPQVAKQLSIIYESPGYLTGISSFTENSRKFSFNEKLIKAFIHLGDYPAGKQILTLMKTEKVTEFKLEYLKSIQELLKEYHALSGKTN